MQKKNDPSLNGYGWTSELNLIENDETVNTMVQYHGELNEKGLPHGYGHVAFSDCRIFLGTFKNGLAHGFGMLKSSNDNKLVGEL